MWPVKPQNLQIGGEGQSSPWCLKSKQMLQCEECTLGVVLTREVFMGVLLNLRVRLLETAVFASSEELKRHLQAPAVERI